MSLGHGASIVRNGLILHVDAANVKSYPGSGAMCTNLSNQTVTGTLTNGPSYSSNNNGTFIFDGGDDHIDFGDIYSDVFVGLTAKFTVSAWVKPNSSVMTNGYIIGKWAAGSGGEWVLRVGDATGNNRANFLWSTPTASAFINQTGTISITNTAKWYNIVGVYDITLGAANSAKIYVDNVDVSTYNQNNQGSPTAIEDTSTRLIMGNRLTLDRGFNGSIANTMIYNRALSVAEINKNFNALRGRYGI